MKKQIKEMAECIEPIINNEWVKMNDDFPSSEEIAKAFYVAGYRKQGEGEWMIKTDEYDCEYMMCSECKEEFYPVDVDTVDTTPNFCPNCGAKMKGASNG